MNEIANFSVRRVKTILDVVDNWPFFSRGLAKLNTLTPNRQVAPEEFFKVLCHTINQGLDRGHIAIYCVGDKQIGYTVTMDNTTSWGEKSVVVFAAYSVATVRGMSKIAWKQIEAWARSNGFVELQAFSPRINGTGFYLFEKCFGFRRQLVFFTKKL